MSAVSIVGASAISAYGAGWRGLGRALAGGRAMAGVPAEIGGGAGFDRARKMMSRGAKLAASCVHALMQDVGWSGDGVGYYLGVGASGGSIDDLTAMLAESMDARGFSLARFGDRGLGACNPLLAFQLMNNFTLCHGAILDGINGPNAAVFSRGAGTTAALIEAVQAIRDGDCTRAIAGGADSAIHPVTAAELARDGFVERGLVPAEGAALVAIEAGRSGLAVIDGCAIASGRARSLGDALDEARRTAGAPAPDRVVIAAWGRPAADAIRAWVRERVPGAAVVETAMLGDSLAALPALAWASALDFAAAERVLVIAAGIDGDVGVVALSPCEVMAGEIAHGALDESSVSSAVVEGLDDARDRRGAIVGDDAPDRRGAVGDRDVRDRRGARADDALDLRRAPVADAWFRPRIAGRPRAVITGVGVVAAFGFGSRSFFGGLAEGRSAVGPIRSFDASTFPTRVAGEVPVSGDIGDIIRAAEALDAVARPGFEREGPARPLEAIDATWLVERLRAAAIEPEHAARLAHALDADGALRDRKLCFGLLAAAEAWACAGCGVGERGAALAIALGLEQAFLEDFSPIFDDRIAWEREPSAGLPRVRFRSPVDLCARGIRELLDLSGPAVVNASACAAGALALANAASLVERGAASIVVCGASDSMVNPLGIGGMSRLGAPSPRHDLDACRPFDRDRDGLAIGEGAAVFVVEDEARARARGARPLARILGWGSTQDAYRVTAPRPDGAAAAGAMRRALARADLAPERVGYINAHGTGTPLNDPAECRAIRAALGAHADRVAVSSIKGAIGHLMAASGAIEIAACLLAFERDLLPGTAHLRNRDPACDLDVIGPEPRRASVDVVMSNSFGFGGQNASVVLGRPR